MFRTLTFVGALSLAAMQAVLPASAQDFPKKQPIKIIVAAPPGGGTDVLARITADFLSKEFGQAVVVENKPGAASAIGADFVAKSAPDGYTLHFTASELPVIPAVRSDLPYKFEDFTFLSQVLVARPLMFVSPKVEAKTLPDLIAYMKANPGKVRYGSTGVGAVVHLGIAMFESATGVKLQHVPYSGSAPIYTDMLAGNIEITEASPTGIPDGIRVIASIGSKRHPGYPDIPTAEESGIKGATWDLWYGMVAPPKLPKPIADQITAAISTILKNPEFREKLKVASKTDPDIVLPTGDAFRKQALEENARWKEVAAREKIAVK
jgi:tripartite-type tricarboxylate transporter receptor subunit TctC